MELTDRQRKILDRLWQWAIKRNLTIDQYAGYCGSRGQAEDAPSTVFVANWNEYDGQPVRPFRGLPKNYQEATARGMGTRYAVPRRRNWSDILERIGFETEWSDEWAECDACNRIFRTQPDGYGWRPEGTYIEGDRVWDSPYHERYSGELCLDCLEEWARGCREAELQDALRSRVADSLTDRQTGGADHATEDLLYEAGERSGSAGDDRAYLDDRADG